MSVQLDRLVANDRRFSSYHYEHDGYGNNHAEQDRPSIWLYCETGFIIPEKECGSIHTKTVKEALRLAATVEIGTE
tara:strand:+ start:208 stop:435 length:228 start_codon:yes stop_codon:yes gene_type:complete